MSSLRKQLVGLGSMMAVAVVLALGWLNWSDRLTAQQAGEKQAKDAEKPAPPGYPMPAKDQAIMKALDSTLKFDFKGAPIKEVLEYIEKSTKGVLEFLPDQLAFRDAGQDMDVFMNDPVIFNRQMKVRKFLHILLYERGFAYYLEDGIVCLAPKAKADTQLISRVYPVANLIGGPRLVKLAQAQALQGNANGYVAMLDQNVGELVAQLTSAVDPGHWKLTPTSTGPGTIKHSPATDSLLITCSLEVHYLLMASGLLDNLRHAPLEPSEKELKTVVVKAYSIAGLLDEDNLKQSREELTRALDLLMPTGTTDKGLSADLAILTDAQLVVVRQPLEVQRQIESLLGSMRSHRLGASMAFPAAPALPNGLMGMGGKGAARPDSSGGVFGMGGGGVFGNTPPAPPEKGAGVLGDLLK